MSQYLDSLEINDTIDIRGPEGKVTYLGRGELICYEISQKSHHLVIYTIVLHIYFDYQVLPAPGAHTNIYCVFVYAGGVR